MPGNVGDNLINAATRQLFEYFDIEYRELDLGAMRSWQSTEPVDEIVISGGGNMGTLWNLCSKRRLLVLATRLPVTVLPQSFTNDREDLSGYHRIYVRERASQALDPGFILAPDLALGYADNNDLLPAEYETGVFLREDRERSVADNGISLCDPITICWRPEDYIAFASRFASIVTDRLHFAIAGLIAGRDVTLLPNSYGKNRSIYETWLEALGCRWRDDAVGIDYDRDALVEAMWPRLAGVPGWGPVWSAVPERIEGDTWTEQGESVSLLDNEGDERLKADLQTQFVWSLCDGRSDLRGIAGLIGDAWPDQRVEIARDVRSVVEQMAGAGAVNLDHDDDARRRPIRVQIEADLALAGWHYRRASLVVPDRPDEMLWYAVPDEYADCLDRTADTFLIAVLMLAMRQNRPLVLEGGKVTASLLANLDSFQATWDEWRLDLHRVKVTAGIHPGIDSARDGPVLLAFSGGLDSAYSAWQLLRTRPVRPFTGLMVHGFDIPLSDRTGFAGALRRARNLLGSRDVEVIPMQSNFRAVHDNADWGFHHASAIAAALTLLSSGFKQGLISATLPRHMKSFWGSNPTTDPLFGSDRFPVAHCGDEVSRLQKLRAIAGWPEALANLRVCWQGQERDRNCGRCPKCLLTRLSFASLGLAPACFDEALDDGEIMNLLPAAFRGRMEAFDAREIAAEARRRGLENDWIAVLEARTAWLPVA